MRFLAALLVVLSAGTAWADCPMDLGRGRGSGWVIFSEHYLISFRPEPAPIEVGRPFSLLLNVCTKANSPAELIAVDAQMPEHKHGMYYRPTIEAGAEGRYRVDGLVFHMPGRWELSLDVRAGEESERLTHDFILK